MVKLGSRLWSSATLSTWVSLLVRVGGLAFLLPLVLTRLETHEALVWQMLASVTALVLWLDFGFSPTFSRLIAYWRGSGGILNMDAPRHPTSKPLGIKGTSPTLSAIIGTQRKIYNVLVAIAIAVSIIAGSASLWKPISQLSHPELGWLAWIITIVGAQLNLLNGSNVSILVGLDRIVNVRRVEIIISTLQLLSTSLVTYWTSDLIAIVICYSFWTFPMLVINRRQVSTQLALAGISTKPSFHWDLFHNVWPSVWRSGVGILMSTGIIQGSALVVPQLVPAAEAVAYLLALRLISVVSQLSQAPFYSKLPAMAEAKGASNDKRVADLAIQGMHRAFWTYALGAILLTVIVPAALNAIESSVTLPPQSTLTLLSFAFFAERYTAMHIQLFTLTNRVIWHIVNGVIGATMVILSILTWKYIGIDSLPLSMLLSYAIVGIFYTATLSVRSISENRTKIEIRTTLLPAALLFFVLICALYF